MRKYAGVRDRIFMDGHGEVLFNRENPNEQVHDGVGAYSGDRRKRVRGQPQTVPGLAQRPRERQLEKEPASDTEAGA